MIKKVLVVCVGNICRSPTAAWLLENHVRANEIQVRSAGLAALTGQDIEPRARHVLEEQGHRPTVHQARQLTAVLVNQADLILVMERRHVQGVLTLSPEARGKVFLLGNWQARREIADPYGQGRAAFVHAYHLIEQAVSAWALRLVR
ncbi:MAG: low molecular weight phosphotyrosine protein phosphatase [Pseudomonas sp.]|nr:low molecular weight phosphotyrosine protein phosphatase [Pseudomonas sp.]